MAPLNQNGVVNNTGHVHGVKDLKVADASIIPFTVDRKYTLLRCAIIH